MKVGNLLVNGILVEELHTANSKKLMNKKKLTRMTHGRIKEKKMVPGSAIECTRTTKYATYLLLPLPRQTFR